MASDKDFRVRIELEGREEFAAEARRAAAQANGAFRGNASGLATGVPNLDADTGGTPKRAKNLDRIAAASARLARQERAEALSRLSLEEQLQRLLRRREAITGRLVDSEGNAYRTAVLNLGGRQLDAAINGVRGKMGNQSGGGGLLQSLFGGSGGYFARRELLELGGARGLSASIGARGLGSLIGGEGAAAGLGSIATVGIGIGAIAVAAYGAVKAISALTNSMRALSDTAIKSGLSTTEVQRINFAAGATGSNSSDLLAAAAKLRETNIAALSGDQHAALLLSRAGLEAGGNPASQLFALSSGLRSGSTSRSAAAGLVGEDGLPALINGASDAAKAFDQLNLAISPGDVQALSNVKGKLSMATTTLGSIFKQVAIASGFFSSINPGVPGVFGNRTPGGNVAADSARAQAAIEDQAQLQRDREAYKLNTRNNETQLESLLKAVTLRQRVNYLLSEQARLQKLADSAFKSGDALNYETQRGRLLENTDALRGTVGQSDIQRTNAGALASIGIFRGVNGEALANVPRQQLLTLRQILQLMRTLPADQARALLSTL